MILGSRVRSRLLTHFYFIFSFEKFLSLAVMSGVTGYEFARRAHVSLLITRELQPCSANKDLIPDHKPSQLGMCSSVGGTQA